MLSHPWPMWRWDQHTLMRLRRAAAIALGGSLAVAACQPESPPLDKTEAADGETDPKAWVSEVRDSSGVSVHPTAYCDTDSDGSQRRCAMFEATFVGAGSFLTGVAPGDSIRIRFNRDPRTVTLSPFNAFRKRDTLSGPPWVFRGPDEPGYHEYAACAEWKGGDGCWAVGIKTADPRIRSGIP